MKNSILIIEDEKLVRWSLKEQLLQQNYFVVEAENGQKGREMFLELAPDLLLLDIRLPDVNGLDLLEEFQKHNNEIPIIIMTGHGNVEIAIEAMRQGARDYIDKPFNIDELDLKIKKALQQTAMARELKYLRKKQGHEQGFDRIVSVSEKMKAIIDLAKKVCKSPSTTILIQGESGTGKDVLARAIHAHSNRCHKPFMNVTCSALPEQLLESELFGHEKGAFTDATRLKKGLFEFANKGTIFLDELGETSKGLQAKLLRVLEEKSFKRVGGSEDIHVDVRVIAASNLNLEKEVEEGRFREDLFYRLNIVNLTIPPLRQRREDILPLAQHFILEFNREFKRKTSALSKAAQQSLMAYNWPGNIRELKNSIERALILSEGDTLEEKHFALSGKRFSFQDSSGKIDLPEEGLDFEQDVEKAYIIEALKRSDGVHGKAAQLLAMNRDQIRYRIKKFGLETGKIVGQR
jgi:DNA-binding NtrC family response regulator